MERCARSARSTTDAELRHDEGVPIDDHWLTTFAAADVFDASPRTAVRWARQGRLVGLWDGTRWLVDPAPSRSCSRRRTAWMSFADVARVVGCSVDDVAVAARAGCRCNGPKRVPSITRSVRTGRLPGAKRGVRVWVRRDHAERAAAARAFRATASTGSHG